MLKKAAITAAAAASILLAGAPAYADGPGDDDNFGAVNGDVLENIAATVCDNNINALLGIQVTDILNGNALGLVGGNDKPVTPSQGGDNCVTGINSNDYESR